MLLRSMLNTQGYAHRRDLIDAGWSNPGIRNAVQAEGLRVVRRAWILSTDAGAAFGLAAASGGRVTCVSAAASLGLWRPGHDDTTHVWLDPHSGTAAPGARVHRMLPVVAAGQRTLIDPLENILAAVSGCLAHDDALSVWESAVSHGLTTIDHLLRVEWHRSRATTLAREISARSDSGLETLGVSRLRRAGFEVRQQVVLEGHPVDVLIGTHLVVQFDGFAHHQAKERRRDIAHDRRLRLRGYTVLRFDYHDVVNDWPRVVQHIRSAVAQGLHLGVD